MRSRKPRVYHDKRRQSPLLSAVDEGEIGNAPSLTAVSIEALRSGVLPFRTPRHRENIPHEDDLITVGDPDDNGLDNEYVGDETPGGTASTPDQNDVDLIGRAYGLQDEDSGELKSAGEVLEERDRRRRYDWRRPPRRR
jgi:hypothetical protein